MPEDVTADATTDGPSADEPRRALAVAAHPDDIEFGCAATVAKLVDAGWQVTYAIATRGEAGSQDAADDPEAFGELRRAEALAAAEAVGVHDVRFLGFVDGEVRHGPELQEAIARVFRQVRPHRVFAPTPAVLPGGRINHPDHRAVGEATLDTCLAAGTTGGWFRHLALDEGLAPWKGLEDVWLFGPGMLEHVEDVGATFDRKIAALAAHASQLSEDTLDWVAERFGRLGAQHGFAHGEGFELVRMR